MSHKSAVTHLSTRGCKKFIKSIKIKDLKYLHSLAMILADRNQAQMKRYRVSVRQRIT